MRRNETRNFHKRWSGQFHEGGLLDERILYIHDIVQVVFKTQHRFNVLQTFNESKHIYISRPFKYS